MKTLIVYASKYGTTRKCAEKLAKQLQNQVDLWDLKTGMPIDLSEYYRIVIGGPIYAGKIRKRVRDFVSQHQAYLLQKELGLFICCLDESEVANQQYNSAYPEELRKHAKASGLFGGEVIMEQMNFLERSIMKMIAKDKVNVSKINEEAIANFATKLQQ
jgi:menaquinone-dependent protoporphyrinogen oxidase